MKRPFVTVTLPVCLAIGLSAAWFSRAGNLNPPAGPVTPTMKDLDDVEPRRALRNVAVPIVIAASGSYYLAENIEALPGQHGIEIVAPRVTLDLNGFSIIGDRTASLDGIHVTSEDAVVDIHDGTILNFMGDGVDAILARNSRLHNITSVNNGVPGGAGGPGGAGLRIGPQSLVSDCRVSDSGGVGISAAGYNVIRSCNVAQAGEEGIRATTGSTIEGCSVVGSQLAGIKTFLGCNVTRCAVAVCADDGIVVDNGSTVAQCSVEFVVGNGIFAGQACVIAESTAHDTLGSGIIANISSRVRNCAAAENIGSGVVILGFGAVSGTSCNGNGLDGIFAFGPGNTISDCSSTNNSGDGVHAVDSLVIGCTLIDNSGSSISGGATSINNHAD